MARGFKLIFVLNYVRTLKNTTRQTLKSSILFAPSPPISTPPSPKGTITTNFNSTFTKRHLILKSSSLHLISLATSWYQLPQSLVEPSKSVLSEIANTKSWFQFYGDGFSIRVPPQFEDILEPELRIALGQVLPYASTHPGV